MILDIVIIVLVVGFLFWFASAIAKSSNEMKNEHKESMRVVRRAKVLLDKTQYKFDTRRRRLAKIKPPKFYDSSLSKKTNHEINLIVNKEFESRKRLIFSNLMKSYKDYCQYYNKIIDVEMLK